jgi:thioredoxin-related protein
MEKLSGLLLIILWLPIGNASANDPFSMLKDSSSLSPDRVLILVAEIENCSFCKRVKNNFLLPLTQDKKWEPMFQVRRIDLNSLALVTDFSADTTTQKNLAQALSADFSPTVLFLDPRSGERIGQDIIGLVTPDFYGFYLQQQIAQSYEQLTGL